MTWIPESVSGYFDRQGWKIAGFQKQAWEAYLSGRSGLVHAPTGTGKSIAAWMGPLIEALREKEAGVASNGQASVLWVTPLRALAADTVATLQGVAMDLGVDWKVELRTGDTPSSVKARQKKRLPDCLVTTPESLSVALSYREFQAHFRSLRCVVVDEWHELISTKRGVQLELCLARIRKLATGVRTWGLSATLGDPKTALNCLLGESQRGVLITAPSDKRYEIRSLMPESVERFPWSGHLGLTLLPKVVKQIQRANTTLVFTNTRSQAEIWFDRLRAACPELRDSLALHHGSLSREVRDEVEAGLKGGGLRCVVCTSSLDLGVDFQPVDQAIQIGSPKGVARLLQRAGRSGHKPGEASFIFCVPTNALELAEIAAARTAYEKGEVEPRLPLRGALDVLAQHCVTLGLADGFEADVLYEEARSCFAFRDLSRVEWDWVLQFVASGGAALQAYPQYRRLERVGDFYRGASRQIALRHRMSIGTISSDTAVRLKWMKGGYLGSVEESFIGRLKKGDSFLFGGRLLELVNTRDMTANVRVSKKPSRVVPRWQGGRMPLSIQVSETLRGLLAAGLQGGQSPELERLRPLLELQGRWSQLPSEGTLLVERTRTREGCHLYFFPFAGRSAHEGLGNLVALRLSRLQASTFHVTANDYGFEVFCRDWIEVDEDGVVGLLGEKDWARDLAEGINEAELSKRRFRDIARIAGLVFPGYPGRGKSTRQLQASSELIFEVLRKYDSDNRLLGQALREVMENEIEENRMAAALRSMAEGRIRLVDTERLTPLAFPLWAERIRGQTVSSETWETRVRAMVERLNKEADRSLAAVP